MSIFNNVLIEYRYEMIYDKEMIYVARLSQHLLEELQKYAPELSAYLVHMG